MSLRKVHDFELALLDPILAMTERGLLIDEPERQEMLATLAAAHEPLTAEAVALVMPALTAALAAGKLPRANLFRERWTCACCRNGAGKRSACWACAGFAKKPGKLQLVKHVAEGKPQLAPCAACDGVGQRTDIVFKPSSPDQLRIVLYNVLKLPKRMAGGKLTTDEAALKSLVAFDKSGLVPKLLELRKLSTMRSILERIAPGADGRIRTFYNPAGTETGRFSSAQSFLEVSTNLQNLPKKTSALDPRYDVRRCIVAPEGCVLMEGDLSQAEARVVAALCDDRFLLDHWQADFDVHRWTAAQIFGGKATEAVTKEERHLGKVARHALNYGMGWKTLLENVNNDADMTGVAITAAQAKHIHAAYHKLHPSLQRWWRRTGETLDRTHALATPFGRKRTFFGRRSGERWLDGPHKEAIAFVPQSAVADLLNTGLLNWWRQFDGKVGRVVAQIHDAILLEVPERLTRSAALYLKRCLEIPLVVGAVTLTIPADVSVGRRWSAMEKV